MLDDNLIATLEKSLRQTRNAQDRLIMRLNEVEGEAHRLRQEIQALENSAEQTGEAINSILETVRSGKQNYNFGNNNQIDENYEIPPEIQKPPRINSRNKQNQTNNYGNQNNSSQNYRNNRNNNNVGSYNDDNYNYNDDNYNNDSGNYQDKYNGNYQDRNKENSQVSYINKRRNISPIAPKPEPLSRRFYDRTITQSCRLLLLEAGEPLHVAELYNLLVEGGFEFKGNNPTISIAVSLNRNRRFKKVAPGTFDLALREASQAVS